MKEVRLKPLEPPFSPEIDEALRRRMPRTATVTPLALFRLLVKDEALSTAMEPLGRFHLKHAPGRFSSIEPRDREIIIDRVCARCGCEYEWGVHVATFAAQVALTPDQVAATTAPSGSAPPSMTGRDRLLLRFVDQLHDTAAIDDQLWLKLLEIWTEAQILQMLVLAGWYHAISYVANAARLPLEDWAARFPGV
jgi:4-carboxymuconolactone decarboxylase